MKTHVTTNIRLEAHVYEQLKRIAWERRMSLSALFREMAAALVSCRQHGHEDPIWELGQTPFDAGPGAPRDVAVRHDDYLYGEQRGVR